MIREVFEKKVVGNLDFVVDIISSYFGDKYKNEFKERENNISILLVRNKGVIKTNDGERYVGDEPLCIKEDDGNQIVVPISFLEEECGNVIFVHLVLHALFNDSLKKEYDELNEVIVDYIANDIAKVLERKKVNVTLCDEPSYESKSLYSKCFDIVGPFLEENKREVVEALVNGDASQLYAIDELSNWIIKRVDSFVFEEVPDNKFKK